MDMVINNILNTYAGIPVLTVPKNIKVKRNRTFWRRLYIRPLWPFGNVKWEYKSILDGTPLFILRGFDNTKILIAEEGIFDKLEKR